MDTLVLSRDGKPIAEFALTERFLEVGRAPACDIVIHEAEVAPRQALVHRRNGAAFVFPVLRGGGIGKGRPVPLNTPLQVGQRHTLTRAASSVVRDGAQKEPGTSPLSVRAANPARPVGLLVGSGAAMRMIYLVDRPLTLGTAQANDIMVADPAVSALHCRVEPAGRHVFVRDLGSRNGTWIGAARIELAEVGCGASFRVGRTNVCVAFSESSLRGQEPLVAASPVMLKTVAEADRLAPLRWPVLIHGETGSGKELIAKRLHARSGRRGQWVALNAGGLSPQLVESELFGHEKGAFTGAMSLRKGAFEQADEGTLFLDEVGELSLDLQARLLRVLEEGELRRLGADRSRTVNVRLLCATHRDLPTMVREGRFRQDLYFRIARLVIEVPPLRRRPQEVHALARHFLEEMREELGPKTLSGEASALLVTHRWPGNVRELRNVLSLAAVGCFGPSIDPVDVQRALKQLHGDALNRTRATDAGLHATVAEHGGNLSAAARALGVPRSTLRDRLIAASKASLASSAPAL